MTFNSIKELVDTLSTDKSVIVDKEFLERNLYYVFQYYFKNEPNGEFLNNYPLNKFDLKVATKYYLETLINEYVKIEITGDFVKCFII